jgi:hypothetical protein
MSGALFPGKAGGLGGGRHHRAWRDILRYSAKNREGICVLELMCILTVKDGLYALQRVMLSLPGQKDGATKEL